MPDPNMVTALRWANEIGSPPTLPSTLQSATKRAKLVKEIDKEDFANALYTDYQGTLSDDEKVEKLERIARVSKSYITDVVDDEIRKNISLRLWSGCLSAAKTIALETMNGPMSADNRALIFHCIDLLAEYDLIFCAGVEAAPYFKKELCKQDYSFDGVPRNSPVRRYPS